MASPASGKGKTACVLFFHGLGDSGSSWTMLPSQVGRMMSWLNWSFPDAPRQPVSCNFGARMPSWFDLREIPVPAAEHHSGLDQAVKDVHRMLKDAEAQGFSSDRIVLGGFSQGGCLALQAGLTAPAPIGGIIALSGWASAGLVNANVHNSTPIFIGHGADDDVVPISSMQKTLKILKGLDCTAVRSKTYRGLGHSVAPEEFRAIGEFLAEVLPEARLVDKACKAPKHTSKREGASCCVEIGFVSVKGLVLDISPTQLRLSGAVPGAQPICIDWKAKVKTDKAYARFSKSRGLLRVRAAVEQ